MWSKMTVTTRQNLHILCAELCRFHLFGENDLFCKCACVWTHAIITHTLTQYNDASWSQQSTQNRLFQLQKILEFQGTCSSLSHFLCFLHLQVQSQPLENTQTLKGPEAPVVKNRWARRSLETAPTDATAQRASRWPRSEIV